MEDFLCRAGAEGFPHAHGRTLLGHLLETRAILRRWRQPPYLQDAGALHSIYATDVYQRQLVPLARRDEVRAAVGVRAERLAYLFGAVSRKGFFELLAARATSPAPPDEPLAVPTRFAGPPTTDAPGLPDENEKGATEAVSRDEAYDLLVLYMANEAEQAQGPAGEPGPWVARVSRMGALLPRSAPRLPPPFASCTDIVSPEDEAAARKAYLEADPSADPDEADSRLAAASAACPWLAEPRVWRATLALRRGETLAARLHLVDARRLLTAMGVAWDKRLTYDEWLRLILSLESFTFRGDAATAALPPPDPRDPRPLLDAATRASAELPQGDEAGIGTARFHRYMDSFADAGADARKAYYPGLASRPWYDPAPFPLARALEDNYDAIRRELLALEGAGFHRESERIGRTGSWDVFLLYERGRKNAENCARCPVTARIVETHNTVRTLAGLIYYSRMKPGTHIAAHRGPTNLRLRCHLGLQVPEGDCAIRVGGEARHWREGECLVFDDYYEHEAWNHTSGDRIVLIVDLWHPDLSSTEIALLEGLHRYAYTYAHDLNRYWSVNERSAKGYD